MDTEKRLALCFALSMLIIIGFSWYNTIMNPPVPQKTGERSTPTISSQATREPAGQEILQPVPPTVQPQEEKAVPAATQSSWGFMAAAPKTEESPGEVVVESDLYRITFSPYGAVPTSWNLLQFDALYADRRYLEMLVKQGTPKEQAQAEIELALLEQRGAERLRVNAIDPTFSPGDGGLHIHWGKNQPDRNILYTPELQEYRIQEPTDVVFRAQHEGVTVEKIFRFDPSNYRVDLTINLSNQTDQPILLGEENFYDVNWFGGFSHPSLRWDALNNFIVQQDGGVTVQPVNDLFNELGNRRQTLLEYYSDPMVLVKGGQVGWVGVSEKYFISAIVPTSVPTDTALKGFSSAEEMKGVFVKPNAGLRMGINSIRANAVHTDKFTLYVGPLDEDNLAIAGAGLEDAHQVSLKWLVGPIAYLMLRLLQGLYFIVPNYGVAIILLTILIKLIMLPVYHKQMASMKKMQAIQPQMNALREQYKNEPQKLQKEQMELFRKHKVNPLAGCLPIIVTIPIFIALYATFNMAVELRGAHFFWWIQDLSSPDRAFFIPIGSFILTVNILPLAYAALMLWSTSQQKIEGPNATMMKIFPLMFVFFFWSIASGVILYFVVSIFIDTIQRLLMDKFQKGEQPPLPTI